MIRIPINNKVLMLNCSSKRMHHSSSAVRRNFIDYFIGEHNHMFVKSSSVVPLCDPTVPYVNAGMNQFKGIFLGKCLASHPRVVNSQKCVRVGGKHNDLAVVGTDGHHHTFFEMLGNWSFGDYYKEEACKMAWDLLLGPFRLKPENLLVTYFAGDRSLGVKEDKECREIWRKIGVEVSRIKPLGVEDNFWEMGTIGPCGPCTEIHYINPDGSFVEIWNIVFIQYNRESDGSVALLPQHHVDTGMGFERIVALLQGVPSNYDTDLFQPLIKTIEQKTKNFPSYGSKFGPSSALDSAYRCLADHARMISVCLADGVFPASSLNLKQIMRKSFKLSEDMFQCKTGLLSELYDQVAESLGPAYPELLMKRNDAKRIIEHEEQSYIKLKSNIHKKWSELAKQYPEVENLHDIELPGFVEGYKQFKQAIANKNIAIIPGELVFKMYDTHGFPKDVIGRIAQVNQLAIDEEGFQKHLDNHKSRHKLALREQTERDKFIQFDKSIENLLKSGLNSTNDQYKYNYSVKDDIFIEPLNTELVAILNENGEWIDFLEANDNNTYYLVTENTNFYCEEGGQAADTGIIKFSDNIYFNVDSVFKIKDFVFHKGTFVVHNIFNRRYVKLGDNVILKVDDESRFKTMKNHTAIHLLNAAIRKVLPNSVLCQIGSSVTKDNLTLSLAVYGDKLCQNVILEAQNLIREILSSDIPLKVSTVNSIELLKEENVTCIPGERYPETDLRLVQLDSEALISKELCCGTHLPSTRFIGEFCIISVKAANGHTPTIYAVTGEQAKQIRELTQRAESVNERAHVMETQALREEIADIQQRISQMCTTPGAPYGEHATCLNALNNLKNHAKRAECDHLALHAVAEAEVRELAREVESGSDRYVVHFLRCSYLMKSSSVSAALAPCRRAPAMLLGCADGIIHVACHVPQAFVTKEFTAEKWLSCVLPVFQAKIAPPEDGQTLDNFASMKGAKVSLITCEQLVQDAMQAAATFADLHTKEKQNEEQDRRHN